MHKKRFYYMYCFKVWQNGGGFNFCYRKFYLILIQSWKSWVSRCLWIRKGVSHGVSITWSSHTTHRVLGKSPWYKKIPSGTPVRVDTQDLLKVFYLLRLMFESEIWSSGASQWLSYLIYWSKQTASRVSHSISIYHFLSIKGARSVYLQVTYDEKANSRF